MDRDINDNINDTIMVIFWGVEVTTKSRYNHHNNYHDAYVFWGAPLSHCLRPWRCVDHGIRGRAEPCFYMIP